MGLEDVSNLIGIPSVWLSSPEIFLTNLLIPFALMTAGIYCFLCKMRIFGYKSTVYVILAAVISLSLTIVGRIGMLGGIIAGLYLLFGELRANLLVKITILIGFLIIYFFLIPKIF